MDYFVLTAMVTAVLSCIGISGFLCYKGIEGWGWFLFIALMLSTGFKVVIH